MKCDQATEFVSALCDGETVPSAAAEHIGGCRECQDRLRDYIGLGVELRRVASLDTVAPAQAPEWKREPQTIARYWQKGWETMKIPRFAFGLLVAVIVVLGSSLALFKVGARPEGNVALLTMDFGAGEEPIKCVLAIGDKRADACGGIGQVKTTNVGYRIDLIGHDGHRLQLAIRSEAHPLEDRFSTADLDDAPQQQVWFEPGETTRVEIAPGITLSLTGQWTDHVPSFAAQTESHDLDPGPDELRMVGPLLLQGKTVAGDMSGMIGTADKPNMAVDIYMPAAGRFLVSLTPVQGAVSGKVLLNRISFSVDGNDYVFVTGAPVTRGDQVWVLRDANFKPQNGGEQGYLACIDLVHEGFIAEKAKTR